MRTIVVVALALALGLWISALPEAQAAQTGSIEGTVANGTADGGSVGGLAVTLHKWQEDVAGSQIETTTTDSTGAFQFDGFEITTGYLYGVSVLYEDVHYWNGPLDLSEENPEVNGVQVNVYETTTSADDIKIILDHVALVANLETQFLEVWNVVQFDNQGDRTYIGSDEGTEEGTRLTVRFPLPAGATRIEALEGMQFETLRLTGDGFADSEPLEPGPTSMSFVYDLEYADGKRTFQKIVQYPTDKVAVLAPRGGIDVVSPDLPSREETQSDAGAMTVLSRENVSPGTSIEIQVSGIASGDGDGLAPEDVLPPLTIALVAVVLAGAVVYALIRRRITTERGG